MKSDVEILGGRDVLGFRRIGKEVLSKKEILDELLFMGLRIREGIKLEKFRELGIEFNELFDKKLVQKLVDEKMMVIGADSVKLTDKGLLLHTNIVRKLS